MEQRAKQLAALTLEDEEEVKKEVREVSESLEIMLQYLKAPTLLRKTNTENPWKLYVLITCTPVNICTPEGGWAQGSQCGFTKSSVVCTQQVVVQRWKKWKPVLFVCSATLLWSSWNLCESMPLFSSVLFIPLKKNPNSVSGVFPENIKKTAENFRLSLERPFCWETFVYLRLQCLYRFSVSRHVLKRHRVIIQ